MAMYRFPAHRRVDIDEYAATDNQKDTARNDIIDVPSGNIFLPILYIAPLFLGLKGVEMTQAIADVLTFLLAIPIAISVYRKLKLKS